KTTRPPAAARTAASAFAPTPHPPLPTPEKAIVPRARNHMDLHNTTAAASHPIYSPTPVPVEQFIDGIRELSAGLITKQKIYDFLATYEIRSEELERYKMWLPDRHTRNKV